MTKPARILAEMFANDPLLGWWDRSGANREKLFEAIIGRTERGEGEMIGDPNLAIAIYELRNEIKYASIFSQTISSVRFYGKFIRRRDIPRLLYVSWILARLMPRGRFLHFQYLMASPSARGLGHADYLIDEVKAAATKDRVPIHLETTSASRSRYLRRRGFEVIHTYDLPCGPRIWTMTFGKST